MNFFKLYIGDYLRDTGTLTLAQHGAYVLMLLEHYGTEKPLPTGRELHRLLRADGKMEREAADFIAAKFWTLTDDGLVNTRSAKEFARADEIAEKNRAIALAREAQKRARTEHDTSTKRAQSVPQNEHDEQHEQSTSGAPRARGFQTPDTRQEKEISPTAHPKPAARGSVHKFPPGFETLWVEYPRKVGKDAAAKAFAKRRPDEALLAAMVEAVRAQRGSPQWAKDGGQFIPHLSTWLNEGRWQDEPETTPRGEAAPAETTWQRSQRERVAAFAPGVAAKAPGARATITLDMEATDAAPRLLG